MMGSKIKSEERQGPRFGVALVSGRETYEAKTSVVGKANKTRYPINFLRLSEAICVEMAGMASMGMALAP
jgi:hypothetical protein